MRRWSKALMAAVAEAGPRRLRTIGPSRAERERARRAENRDLPVRPRKETAPCCLAKRLPDGRPVIGFCGPDCIRRPARSVS